jgi:hypothetical protein
LATAAPAIRTAAAAKVARRFMIKAPDGLNRVWLLESRWQAPFALVSGSSCPPA